MAKQDFQIEAARRWRRTDWKSRVALINLRFAEISRQQTAACRLIAESAGTENLPLSASARLDGIMAALRRCIGEALEPLQCIHHCSDIDERIDQFFTAIELEAKAIGITPLPVRILTILGGVRGRLNELRDMAAALKELGQNE